MTNKSKDSIKLQQSIIGELYALSIVQNCCEIDVFIRVSGHVNLVEIEVIEGSDYSEIKQEKKVLFKRIYADSAKGTAELQGALHEVKALIAQHNGKSQLVQNNHQVASVLSVRSHPLLEVNL
jgi:hypothetical protein